MTWVPRKYPKGVQTLRLMWFTERQTSTCNAIFRRWIPETCFWVTEMSFFGNLPLFWATTLQKCAVNFFSVFSLPRVSWTLAWSFGQIFRVLRFPGFGFPNRNISQNFTPKTENCMQFHSAGARSWHCCQKDTCYSNNKFWKLIRTENFSGKRAATSEEAIIRAVLVIHILGTLRLSNIHCFRNSNGNFQQRVPPTYLSVANLSDNNGISPPPQKKKVCAVVSLSGPSFPFLSDYLVHFHIFHCFPNVTLSIRKLRYLRKRFPKMMS